MSLAPRPVALRSAASREFLPGLPALDNTYGALLLGTAFGLMLYGLTVHQTFRYTRLYPKDKIWLKIFVAGIFVFETFHTALSLVAVYYHLITNYFNPFSLLEGHWSTRASPANAHQWDSDLVGPEASGVLHITIVSLLTLSSSFYVYRVYHIGPHYAYRICVAIAVMLMVGMFAFTAAATVEAFRLELSDFQRFSWLVSVSFGCAVFADMFLTGALITVLWKSRTGFRRTDSLIEVLVAYSINTGLVTGIFGFLGFIFAIILPGNFIYIGISIVGIKLYANSVLAILNSRKSLSDRLLQDCELGTFEPTPGTRPSQAQRPLESWKAARPGAGGNHPTVTTVTFASVPTSGYTIESSAGESSTLQDDKEGGASESRL
ncbi:hypothetical protein C8Q70DRAFT_1057004 [Cubamyces menziesii]|nr:hypothetical protein C8Q70DRAFT_1057004 [Cubamyces menziesii]